MKKTLLTLSIFTVLGFSGDFEDAITADKNKDYKKATELFTLAANKGNMSAQFNLAITYEYGSGSIKKDYIKAIKFYTLSANQGHSDAQFNLGVIYASGKKVKQDYILIYGWCF